MSARPELFTVTPPRQRWEPLDEPAPGPRSPTERAMLDLLHRRYSFDGGNGARYACAEHVRNGAGFDATRTADFVAMDPWPSKVCTCGHG
jgi:hypothetical protein